MRAARMVTVILGLVAATIAAGLYFFLHPSQEPPPRSWPSANALPADERSGYYLQEDGNVRLALPGAYTGYRLYHPDSLHMEEYAVMGAEPREVARNRGPETLKFTKRGYLLRKSDGTRLRAERLIRQPYSVHDLTVDQRNVALAGWLFTPRRARGVGIVIVHGSGRSDRDNAWYVTLADRLARAGAAVVLPDKRGAGRSGGHWWHADYDELADDAATWLELLHTEVSGLSRIGYVGVSQGGRVAPIAELRHGGTDFIAILSAAATTQNEQLRHEIYADAQAQGAPQWLARLLAPAFVRRVHNQRPAWWDRVGETDPITEWRAAKVPLFIAYGREDEADNVPVARSVARIKAALGGSPKVQIHVYERVGHGYIVRPKLVILPRFLNDLAVWLKLDPKAASTAFPPKS